MFTKCTRKYVTNCFHKIFRQSYILRVMRICQKLFFYSRTSFTYQQQYLAEQTQILMKKQKERISEKRTTLTSKWHPLPTPKYSISLSQCTEHTHTWKTRSLPPTVKADWNRMENFSSVTAWNQSANPSHTFNCILSNVLVLWMKWKSEVLCTISEYTLQKQSQQRKVALAQTRQKLHPC